MNNNDDEKNNDQFQSQNFLLLEEFTSQRESLKDMIVELEQIKKNIDKLFPDNIDKRYIRFFEEKVKTTTELFKAILDMRKEIIKSIKDEFEIRRKIENNKEDEENFDINEIINISKLSKKIEQIRKDKDNFIEKTKTTYEKEMNNNVRKISGE